MVRRSPLQRLVCAAALALLATPPAFAWGCRGHQVVALIAHRHLDAAVARKVDAILAADPAGGERGCAAGGLPAMAAAANWADAERAREPATGPYHFIDIPYGARRAGFDTARLCNDDCVTWAIAHYAAQLETAADPGTRADALRYVIHFVGDIHQPLHAEDNADRGGNCVRVHFLAPDNDGNLHSVWDSGIVAVLSGSLSAADWARQIEASHPGLRAGSSNLEDWAWESHAAAVRYAYGALPTPIAADSGPAVGSCAARRAPLPVETLGQAYVDQGGAVVESRLDLAGLRLARLLNRTLGK